VEGRGRELARKKRTTLGETEQNWELKSEMKGGITAKHKYAMGKKKKKKDQTGERVTV